MRPAIPPRWGPSTAVGGNITIIQGNASGDSATIAGVAATGGTNTVPITISITQGSGSDDTAMISAVTAPHGNITITQADVAGNTSGDTASVLGVTLGTKTLAGPFFNEFQGTVTITQCDAPGDVALLDNDVVNNVFITQGDNVQVPNCTTVASDVAEINDTSVTSDIAIIQGTGKSTASNAGNYVAAIGFDYLGLINGNQASSSVTAVFTEIDQNYANNQVFLGDFDSSFTTLFLDVFTGSGGGAYVQVSNTVVDDGALGVFSPYNINGGGDNTSSLDNISSLTVTVNPVITPVLTWTDPFEITYGTALDGTELDATASVPGSFVYTPAAGTVLSAGAGQTLSVTFTPTDTTDYTTAAATATVNVAQATPTLVSVNPVNITYGTALANGQLSGTATWTVNGSPITVAGIVYLHQRRRYRAQRQQQRPDAKRSPSRPPTRPTTPRPRRRRP